MKKLYCNIKARFVIYSFTCLLFVLLSTHFVAAQIPEPNCVCAYCNYPCGSGHSSNCKYNNSPGTTTNGTNWIQAQKEARAAQKIINARTYNELGNAEYAKKNWEKAVKYFKKALRNMPEDQVIRNNLRYAEEAYARDKKSKADIKENEKWQKDYAEKQRKKAEEEQKIADEKKKAALEKQQALDKAAKELRDQKLKDAEDKILALQKNISQIQKSLQVYSKSLHNNTAEFEKWGNTVDVAYKNVIENTKDEITDFMIKYGLLAAFGPATQKLAFSKIRSLIQSNEPLMQKWLVVEAKLKGITPDKVEDLIDKVNAGFELNDLLKGEQTGIKPKLDAMLFVNSLFETFNIYDYKTLMENKKLFGSTEVAGDYFGKAKLIGETYTDLASICYSWFMIDKLTTDNDAFAQKVNILSFNMEYQMKQIDCLKKCMTNYAAFCNEKCTGVTRWSTPPPLLKIN